MSQEGVVITEAKGEVLYLTLNRPEKGNSIEDNMISALTDFFQNHDNFSDSRAVILAGSGKHFCTGADLSWMGDEPTESQSLSLSEMFFSVSNCPVPTIATVHGACLGGGMGLAAACDFVLASKDSTFGFTEVKMGLVPALISPFKNGEIDFKSFSEFIDWSIKEGSHGFVPCGTTGESPTLTHEEHKRVVEELSLIHI